MRFFKWWPKRPKKVYLGWTQLGYSDSEMKTVVHFYAYESNLKRRHIKQDVWSEFRLEHHIYYQQIIIPWINGNNLWGAIKNPSDWLKDHTKENSGHEFIGDKWIKRAEVIKTGNVFKLVKD